MALRNWVRLPSWWIEEGGLRELRWNRGEGADNIAALMALCVIAHHATERVLDDDKAELVASVTYDRLGMATGISREKIANGLDVLESHSVVKRARRGRSTFLIEGYERQGGWCKLPAKGIYFGDRIVAFDAFRLRAIAELDAMKLYLLFASRRNNESNFADISYDKITEFSGVERSRLKRAISVLAANGLVYVEHRRSNKNEHGVANAYRLAHLDAYVHMGTRGRGSEDAESFWGSSPSPKIPVEF